MADYLGQELTQFCLLGHSYGGFLAGQYALAYPMHIKKLLLLSPIGVYQPTNEEMKKPFEKVRKAKKENGNKGPPIWGLRVYSWFWDRKITLTSAMKLMGRERTLKMISNTYLSD